MTLGSTMTMVPCRSYFNYNPFLWYWGQNSNLHQSLIRQLSWHLDDPSR